MSATMTKELKKATTKQYREAWLHAIADPMVPKIEKLVNKKMPEFRISIGFPSVRGLAKKNKRLAECWPVQASTGKVVEIFVSPLHETDLDIAASVCHELIHAIGIKGHKKDFKNIAWQMGLNGTPTATIPGPLFTTFIKPYLKLVGHFPGDEMKIYKGNTDHYKKKETYLIKLQCPNCDMIIRTTRTWLDNIGAPRCSCKGWIENGHHTYPLFKETE